MAFIGLDRSIQNHWIYQDSDYFKIWLEILFSARYAEEPGTVIVDKQLVPIEYGEFIFGRPQWCKRLNISEKKLRNLIDKLIAENMIVLKTRQNKFSKYFVVNYEKYNKKVHQKDQQETSPHQVKPDIKASKRASRGPAEGQQRAREEQREQSNKDNKVSKNLYAPNVALTVEEYDRLCLDHGSDLIAQSIEYLESYKIEKNYKTKSDNLTIRRWVIEAVKKRNSVNGSSTIGRTQQAARQLTPYERQKERLQQLYQEALADEQNRSH